MELAPFGPNHSHQFRTTVTNMTTISGQPVSEEQIDAWVTEAENGYDVDALRRRGRKPRDADAAAVISIRHSPGKSSNHDT